jgi:hypothetical protein
LLIFLHVEGESGYRFVCHFARDDRTIAMMMMMMMMMMMTMTFMAAENILYGIPNIHGVLTLIEAR